MSAKSVTTMTADQFKVLVGQIKRLGKLTNDAIQRAAVFAVYQDGWEDHQILMKMKYEVI